MEDLTGVIGGKKVKLVKAEAEPQDWVSFGGVKYWVEEAVEEPAPEPQPEPTTEEEKPLE